MSLSLEDRIRVKAYALWEAEGHLHGNDLDHWIKAQELLGDSGSSTATVPTVVAADPPYRVALSRVYAFGMAENEPWLVEASGLSFKEQTARWTDGPRTSLVFHLPDACPPQIVIDLTCRGAVAPKAPSVTADVRINGIEVGLLTDSLGDGQRLDRAAFPVPRSALETGRIDLTLDIRDPRKPSDLGMGADDRELGFLLMALAVRPA